MSMWAVWIGFGGLLRGELGVGQGGGVDLGGVRVNLIKIHCIKLPKNKKMLYFKKESACLIRCWANREWCIIPSEPSMSIVAVTYIEVEKGRMIVYKLTTYSVRLKALKFLFPNLSLQVLYLSQLVSLLEIFTVSPLLCWIRFTYLCPALNSLPIQGQCNYLVLLWTHVPNSCLLSGQGHLVGKGFGCHVHSCIPSFNP